MWEVGEQEGVSKDRGSFSCSGFPALFPSPRWQSSPLRTRSPALRPAIADSALVRLAFCELEIIARCREKAMPRGDTSF